MASNLLSSEVRKANYRKSGKKQPRRDDWKAFLVVCTVTVSIVLGTVVATVLSIRPSFDDQTFSQAPLDGEALTLDWPALRRINGDALHGSRRLPVPDRMVRVPGYMLSAEEAPDKRGEVSKFLLVPNAGTWLHPAHMDSDEVIYVRMQNGESTPLLTRRAVWVSGQLSHARVNQGQLEGVIEITASSVHPLESSSR